ncbi:glycosyltransferase family 4 protein [Carboxylicivirga taeanensis]|uniref:glycosyltransferase family 4 protein n=1 Tax=Carboxylicivirga taeanensis TaxID=1416875 RepID=UPI003F6E2C4A
MKRLKIGVFTDLRFTALDSPTGVTKHIVEMVNGLNQNNSIEVIILAAKDQLTAQGQIHKDNALAGFDARRLPFTWYQGYLLWLLTGKPTMDKYARDLDWVYCPKNDFIPFRNVKTAITIHGAHEIDPEYPKNNSLLGRLNQIRSHLSYQRICKRATALLTVSEFLKQQMISWFKVDRKKIHLVGNGVEEVFYKGKTNPLLHNKYQLIAIGGLNRLDGGDRIVQLAHYLLRQNSNYQIVVAGNQHESALLERAKHLTNITLKGYVKAAALSELMQQSQALLFLTRYETFGIAAVEAMASGLPVITCHNTAVPEIVDDAALYTEPDNEIEIFKTIMKLENETIRTNLIKNGLHKAQEYKWDNCIERLQTVITKV